MPAWALLYNAIVLNPRRKQRRINLYRLVHYPNDETFVLFQGFIRKKYHRFCISNLLQAQKLILHTYAGNGRASSYLDHTIVPRIVHRFPLRIPLRKRSGSGDEGRIFTCIKNVDIGNERYRRKPKMLAELEAYEGISFVLGSINLF